MDFMGPVRMRDVEEAQQKLFPLSENWKIQEKLSLLVAEVMN